MDISRLLISVIRRSGSTSSLMVAAFLFAMFATKAGASFDHFNWRELTSLAWAPNGGFWVQTGDQTLVAQHAPPLGNYSGKGSIVSIPGGNGYGYWIVSDYKQIINVGAAQEICGGWLSNCSGCSTGGNSCGRNFTGIALYNLDQGITAGYWLVASDGLGPCLSPGTDLG
jgi:hypothetical protein